MNKHCHVSNLSKEIWSSILEYVPFKSLLLLLETGDTRVQKIRRALVCLELNRTQIRYRPFPVSLLNSFVGIRSLAISIPNHVPFQSSKKNILLPKTLRSLTVTLKSDYCTQMLSLLGEMLLTPSDETSLPALTELTIKNTSLAVLDLDVSAYLGDILKKLPHLTSFVCDPFLHSSVVTSIPKSIHTIKVTLLHNVSSPHLVPINFPNLSTLHLRENCYKTEMNTLVEWPETLTDLNIPNNDGSIWNNMLPPRLSSLTVNGSKPKTKKQVSNLPRFLTSLAVTGDLEPKLVVHLPKTLKTLRNNVQHARFETVDPSFLPPSLTELDMFARTPYKDWKNLPRGLVANGFSFSILFSDEFAMIKDLPASLTSFRFSLSGVTPEHFYSIPSRQVLKHLWLPCGIDAESFLSLFPSKASSKKVESIFPSLQTLNLTISNLKFDILSKFPLPSLVKLRLWITHATDLSVLTLPPTLKNLDLSDSLQNVGNYGNALPSFILSLPSTLTYLGLSNYFVDTLHSSFQHLPRTLLFASFSVLKEKFSFNHLSHLPNSLQVQYLYLVDSEEEFVMSTSLKDILISLPGCIKSFDCSVVKHNSDKTRLRLILEDCINNRDPSSEIDESLKIDIFRQYAPPFMNNFCSTLIDPDRIFKKAIKIMQKPA